MTRVKKTFSPILKDYAGDTSKRWRVEWYEQDKRTVNGKRLVKYGDINKTSDKQERYKRAQKIIAEIKSGKTAVKEIVIPLLEKIINLQKLEWRKSTERCYVSVVKLFSLSYPVHENVDTEQIRNFLLQQKEGGKSPTTLKRYRDSLSFLYQKAVQLGMLKYNPVSEDIKIKKSPKSLMYFNDEQISKIKNILTASTVEKHAQLWLSIQFLFYCFIRPGEQREMCISWINFDAGYIEIPSLYSKNKKTQKTSVPTAFLEQIQYLKNYPKSYYVLGKGNRPSERKIGRNYLNEAHTDVLKEAGIYGHYALYSWKHTGVVMAVKKGLNIKDIQLQLRHHSLDMVNEYLKNLGVMDSEDLKKRFPTI